MNTDEPELVRLCFERNERAIVEAKAKYGPYCHRLAFTVLGNEEDALECENDAYLVVWNSIPPKVPICFRAYLGRIVRNVCLSRLRKGEAQKRTAVVASILEELSSSLPGGDLPEEEILRREFRQLLSEFLDTLPPKVHHIFMLRYWYMRTHKEIASVCGCSEASVRVALHRCRRQIKEFLIKEDYPL